LTEEYQAKLLIVGDANSIEQVKTQSAQWNAEKPEIAYFEAPWLPLKSDEVTATLEKAIATGTEKWGEIQGVFFSTPTTHDQNAAPLLLLGEEQLATNDQAKVQAIQLLSAAIASQSSIRFCCVQSSLSAVLGGVGLSAYAAANHFLDTYATQMESSFPWFSVNWDACLPPDADPVTGFGAAIAAYALTPEQVWQATERILEHPELTQVAVSKVPLGDRLKTTPEQAEEKSKATTHERPQLTQAYREPTTETELAIVEIWQELLGIESIGVDDSFFDLGGHSLLAIQAISRLRERFQIDMAMRNLLFETPTVASIAAQIDQSRSSEDLDVMAELLAEVQNLPSESISQELAQSATTNQEDRS
ncbi:MAG: phosphopantetheine-binding protein, partial [Cyanobacteria bacterium P01_F01_bin.42]